MPGAPSPQQQSQAAQLKSVASVDFDATYLQIQLAGHQLSIADTQTELSSGGNQGLLNYAKGYLPVAQMHLGMTQQDLSSLGLPSSAPAGTGGQAATGEHNHLTEAALLGGLAVVLSASGLVLGWRRRVRPTVVS